MTTTPEIPACPARSWRDVVAPVVSGLCLIHCIGVALLAPVLPGALALVAEDPRLEWGLFGLAAGLGLWMLWRSRSLLPGVTLALWSAATILGVIGLVADREVAVQAALVGLAALQVWAFARRWRAHHHTPPPVASGAACCAHPHPHVEP